MTEPTVAAPPGTLFCFGLGYSALALTRRLRPLGWRIAGTCRSGDACAALGAEGIDAWVFRERTATGGVRSVLAEASHLLVSVPPDEAGDPVIDAFAHEIAHHERLAWIGYLSTTGVYGDHGGAWVDEETLLTPAGPRGARRVAAEGLWLNFWDGHGMPVHIFRLAGIYGPGRSLLDQVRAGTARRIAKPGHMFSRIHVDDIAATLAASIARPHGGRAYNLADDEPAEPRAVVEYACELLGVAPPPVVPWDEAKQTLSPMALSFYDDNKRVWNNRIKSELGVRLRYPTYREGLRALAAL
ncbi:MAG: SDR family oxidoreductase [Alphaproteobacteria bacterium]|nr:SDR family oxidoreductase [Alphaproteobacteria bacterium]